MNPMRIAASSMLALLLVALISGATAADVPSLTQAQSSATILARLAGLKDLDPTDPNEPNDTPDQATSIAYGVPVQGAFGSCNDVDAFTFSGRAGDILIMDKEFRSVVHLLDSDRRVLDIGEDWTSPFGTSLPADGVYYLVYRPAYKPLCGEAYTFIVTNSPRRLLLSFDRAGTIQGIPFTSGDVLSYDREANQWAMFLDMSSIGLKGNLVALEANGPWYWNQGLYLGFAAPYTLSGVGTITPQDLLWYGESYDGTTVKEVFFDGSDVGLTGSAERIDTLASYPESDNCCNTWWNPLLSMTGRGRVPYGLSSMTVENEDLAMLHGHYGVATSGEWQLHFDGSAHNLGEVNVIGASTDWYRYAFGGEDNSWYSGNYYRLLWLAFDRTVRLGGIPFSPGDIALCTDNPFDHRDPCYSVTKYFDASDAGVIGPKVDALAVGGDQ